MPYAKLADLPAAVRDNLPTHGQEIFQAAFNAAVQEYDGDEERAFATAWAAVKKAYHQTDGGKWVANEKAGRRVRGDKVGILRKMQDAWNEFLRWASYEDEEETAAPEEETKGRLFEVVKGKDGQVYLRTWTTNAFQDRDGETFSTKSLEDYAARMDSGEHEPSRFDFWHVPGSEFGTVKAWAAVGRFLVEMGTFDDTPIGQAFKSFFELHPEGHPEIAPDGWGTSHRFAYHAQDRRPDGTFDWFHKDRTTVLPIGAAANPWTKAEVIMAMTEEQKARFAAIGQEVGAPDLAALIEREGEAKTKELEAQGIAHKEAQHQEAPPVDSPAPAPEETAPEETTPEADEPAAAAVKAVTADEVAAAVALVVSPLLEQVKALTTALQAEQAARQALEEQVKALAVDEEQRLKEVVQSTPGASLASMIMGSLKIDRAVGAPENRVDGRTKEGRAGPKETPAAGRGETGIGLLDTILAGKDWREALPGVQPAGNQ